MNKLLNTFDKLAASQALRVRMPVHGYDHAILLDGTTQFIDYTSNDYLHFSKHPDLIQAFTQAAMELGVGSRSSPHISGYSHYHHRFENEFAHWQNREAALYFNSGYHANIGVYPALANRNTLILSDKLVHTSMLDGILLSRAKHHRYHHHDLDHLTFLLKKFSGTSIIIVTESIFSMEGDITPLDQLASLAKNFNALLCVDDAHGIGVMGKTGKGLCDYFNLNANEVPCLIQPLGKAMGGMGAMISGSSQLIHGIEQQARSYRYSTALPASHAAAGIAALHLIQHAPASLLNLKNNILHFNQTAKQLSLTLLNDDPTPIRCILTKNNNDTLNIQAELKKRGHLVAGIRPPTVPANKARLRISLTASHTPEQITQLLMELREVMP